MESANLQHLHGEWQSAVQAHTGVVRDGKMRGLTAAEIDEIACVYVLRIDVAYARLKQAEAQKSSRPADDGSNPFSASPFSAAAKASGD